MDHGAWTDSLCARRRAITRGQLLRAHSSYLPPDGFDALRSHLATAYTDGSLLKEPAPQEGSAGPAKKPNPLEDPDAADAMMDGLKDMISKQAAGFIPQASRARWAGSEFRHRR